MDHTESCGCPEYRELSRRRFMALSGGAALMAAAAPAWLPRVAYARDFRSSQRDVMISIFLRGASDGLTMVAPFTDANYYTLRPTISIPQPDSTAVDKLLALGGGSTVPGPGAGTTTFGLAPALAGLLPAYNAGRLLFVQACGSNDPSRSHFDAQRFMEIGKAQDVSLNTGWLGRHLQTVPGYLPPFDETNPPKLRAVGIASGLQKQLVGGPLTLPIPNLDTFGLAGSGASVATRSDALGDMYTAVADPLRSIALNTFATIDMLNTINFATYAPAGGALYPAGSLGTALKQSAALIKAQVGVEAIAIDYGGWDTHNNQGSVAGGTMANLMTTLGNAIGAFYTDMTALSAPTFTLAAMSEFGRRPAENGSFGSDHGHGNCMIVAGTCVNGGRVLTHNWPGLAPGALYQNLDLQVTIDYRDILAEIVQNRLGNSSLPAVFPDYNPTFRGVFNC